MSNLTVREFAKAAAIALLVAAATQAQNAGTPAIQGPLVVTASNASPNQLLVYNANAQLVQTIATQGVGGVSGNAGGIAMGRNHVAVVNFGSGSVSMFERAGGALHFSQTVPAVSSPVSVAFGNN